MDVNNDEIASVRVLRDMVAGRLVRAPDLANFMCCLCGTYDRSGKAFWGRFARDVLAQPGSPMHRALCEELLVGRGLRNQNSMADIADLVNAIDEGRAPVPRAAVDSGHIKHGAQVLLNTIVHGRMLETEPRAIFAMVLSNQPKVRSSHESM